MTIIFSDDSTSLPPEVIVVLAVMLMHSFIAVVNVDGQVGNLFRSLSTGCDRAGCFCHSDV